MTQSFTFAYRVGTPDNFRWVRNRFDYDTREQAQHYADALEKHALADCAETGGPCFGHKAIVYKTKDLDSIGMPETWE